MTNDDRLPARFLPAVLLACGLGLWWVMQEAIAATSSLPRRAAFLQVPAVVFAVAFIVAADSKGRPPWLRITAVAASIGWVLILASFAIG
jgi:hypothetical protein